jgi:septal ring factor EnvC (AmiA/AmiB activator)
VYTGTNLPGLGQVVILQHPHELMTIYGNNLEKLVNKGDVVSSGQVIARIGQMGDVAPALYFEVRYQGKAEDPFVYWHSALELS